MSSIGAIITARAGSLASGNVYGDTQPDGATPPYVSWIVVSDVPTVTQEAYGQLSTALVQFDCVAETRAAAVALRNQVVAAMCSGQSDAFPQEVGRMVIDDSVTPRRFSAQTDIEITYAP
jgi:hypothetical protein